MSIADIIGWPQLVVSVVGSTAVGKTALSLSIARSLDAEIVSADAFQVYRGLDIGTGKVAPQDRVGVPHHLLDILDVDQQLSVAEFQRLGRAALLDIARRGRPAVVVGGSGLYVRALLDDLRFPGSDPLLRQKWQAECDRMGPADLHRVLAEMDPAAAMRILPTNGRRIVRALEVNELTGHPFQAELPKQGPPLIPHAAIGLSATRDELDGWIAERVRGMIAAGWVQEVATLRGRGLVRTSTAGRALGYPQLLSYLDGEVSLEDAIQDVIRSTRRFARRQERWFRADPRNSWFPAPPGSSTVAAILSHLAASPRNLER